MEHMTIERATALCGGQLFGTGNPETEIGKIVIDTRTIENGDLFAAFRGERVDGHDYIPAAFERGAACCIGERVPEGETRPVIVVPDVLTALEQIAAGYRSDFDLPVVGITGSVGKTTAKEMISAVVEQHFCTLKLFPSQSRRILACRQRGALNGTSLMPNSPHLAECLEMLRPWAAGMHLTVHLNLMEGKSLSPIGALPLLTDKEGVFAVPFLTLLLAPLSPKREEYRRQLKTELRAQIRAVRPFLTELGAPLRLDGHAHWHMLPIVFDALMDVIREDELPVRYIRMPAEPLGLYARHLGHIFPFHPINLVKTTLLRLLCRRNRRRYRHELSGMEQALFLGVLFSGGFTLDKFRLLLPDAVRLAKKRDWQLELLAHPGAVYEPEDIRALTNRDDVAFLTSPARQKEAEAFLKLKEENDDK